MYKMKADGVVFYDPSSDDMTLHVLSPKAKYDLEKAATLTFTMLPGNVAYNSLHKLKTIVTLEQDGEEIFRGRVVETTTNTYNQKEVYCVGELSYLRDSLVRPYKFEGKASDLFRQLVEKHNEQVDDFKRFEVGNITAITDEDETETESEAYADTLAEIRQMLVSPFGGYLRIRWEGDVRYLDYITEYDDECGQAIEFGVNLVDVENKLDASEVFSVLVPLGDYNTDSEHDPITIESVNGGKDYLEDEEAIAQYGRIVKTYKWEDLTDPQEIMDKGLEHFEKMKAKRTLTIKAVDLHIIDASVDSIRLGKKVRLVSSPHGLNEPEICSAIDLDIEKPDKSKYTFGVPQKSLTDSNAARNKQYASDMNGVHKWLRETNNSFEVFVDEVNGEILLMADNIIAQGKKIDLKAEQTTVDEMGKRVSSAEVRLDGAEAAISLKASVDDLNAVELRLDGMNSTITAKADNVRVEALATEITGLLKVEELAAEIAELDDVAVSQLSVGGTAHCTNLEVHGAGSVDGDLSISGDLTINGATMYKTSLTVVTGIDVITNLEGRVTAVQPITTQFYYYT